MYARAQICIDTGLGRYGFPDTHIKEIINTIQNMKHVCITGIYSHFYASSCHNSYHTKTQLEHFTSLCDALEQENVFVGYRHIAASCALFRYPEARLDAVRIGSAGYSHGLETKRNNDCPGITQLPRYIYHLLKNTLFPKQLCAYRGDTAFPVLGRIGMTNVIIDITGYNIKIGDIVSFPVIPIYVDSSIPRIYS